MGAEHIETDYSRLERMISFVDWIFIDNDSARNFRFIGLSTSASIT